MDRSEVWRKLFTNWPAGMPRKGVVVTTAGDQIGFADFRTRDDFVLVHRHAPDTSGARDVLFPFSEIIALKIIDVIKPKTYREAGFVGSPAEKLA